MTCPPLRETQALEMVEQALARGDRAAACAALVPLLEARQNDPACALAVRLMRQEQFAPDAMAATLDRLVHLVRAQEAQIRSLQAMVETGL